MSTYKVTTYTQDRVSGEGRHQTFEVEARRQEIAEETAKRVVDAMNEGRYGSKVYYENIELTDYDID